MARALGYYCSTKCDRDDDVITSFYVSFEEVNCMFHLFLLNYLFIYYLSIYVVVVYMELKVPSFSYIPTAIFIFHFETHPWDTLSKLSMLGSYLQSSCLSLLKFWYLGMNQFSQLVTFLKRVCMVATWENTRAISRNGAGSQLAVRKRKLSLPNNHRELYSSAASVMHTQDKTMWHM